MKRRSLCTWGLSRNTFYNLQRSGNNLHVSGTLYSNNKVAILLFTLILIAVYLWFIPCISLCPCISVTQDVIFKSPSPNVVRNGLWSTTHMIMTYAIFLNPLYSDGFSHIDKYNRVPTSSGNHGKPGNRKKVPCMEKSWNLQKPE